MHRTMSRQKVWSFLGVPPNRIPRAWFSGVLALLLTFGEPAAAIGGPGADVRAASTALRALEQAIWDHKLETDLAARAIQGLPAVSIPDIDFAAAREDAEWARRRLSEVAASDRGLLDRDQLTTLLIAERELAARIRSVDFFWLDFPITPYRGGGLMLNGVHQSMAGQALGTDEDRRRYLDLLREYADLITQIDERVAGQMKRGIVLAKPAVPGARSMIRAFRDGHAVAVAADSERLAGLNDAELSGFLDAQAVVVKTHIVPAFDRLLDTLGERYERRAPESVGLSRYPGGRAYYEYLIRQFTRDRYTPRQVFEFGQARMTEIQSEMAAIRVSLGFEGTQAEFHGMLRTDPRFLAKTPEGVEARYRSYIERIEPLVDDYFSLMPKAPYGLARLDPSLEAGMTFGYYQRPTPDNPVGQYRYNGSQLDSRSLIGAGGLIYHELIPGHHFHIALQAENEALPAFRRHGASLALSAFNEGWAEYAAGLAGEMGLLDDPYDQYGRLLLDAFLTARLVTDPGMNYFGWTLEQAREYMVTNTMQSDVEIASETLRYSTDIPGQAVAYKIGHREILDMRAATETALGEAFDIREFHAVVVGQGAMPLDVLAERVDWYVEETLEDGEYH